MGIRKKPLVSVIITTYNRPNMLRRAIDSVLAQTYEKIEVIVVDDNNPATVARIETEAIMQDYIGNPNVKYIKHKKNMNGATARNTGIKNSSGEIVTFLDDDDWYLNKKVETQVEYLLNNTEFSAVYCGWRKDNKEILPTKEGNLTFEILSGINPVITNTIMMKKKAAVNCGGWDERFRRGQETAFLLRYFKYGYKIGVVTEKLVEFDTSDRSNASSPSKKEKDTNFMLEVHEKQIIECEEEVFNAKKIIYSYRYRSVLLDYIKSKDYLGALQLYLKVIKKIPVKFNLDLCKYIINKFLHKK